MERWLSCCVRGPIMEVGWMDMVCSSPGVRTAPCRGEEHAAVLPCCVKTKKGKREGKSKTLTVGGMMYD